MGENCNLSPDIVDRTRRNPTHTVLLELGQAAREAQVLKTKEFKKIIAYLLDYADGRDRREPLTVCPGHARPIPKLRVTVAECFGTYADLHWFKINKTVKSTDLPLTGLFPHVAVGLGRVWPEDFGYVVGALVHRDPDAALLRLLNRRKGRVRGLGLQLFSRLAFAFRRDLYFMIPAEWGTASGTLRYIGSDLRKYIAFCRDLRNICDDVHITVRTRGAIFDILMNQNPPNAELIEAMNNQVGSTIGQAANLKPTDGYMPTSDLDGQVHMPLEFTGSAILKRRGPRQLRHSLLQAYGNRCAFTGTCVKDLLEVAHVTPFPSGDVNSLENVMLLRTDLHTLWDLNLIALDPQDMTIHVSKRLRGSVYENLAGRTIVDRRDGSQLSTTALLERWELFGQPRSKTKKAAVMIEPSPTASPRRGKANGAETPQVVTVETR